MTGLFRQIEWNAAEGWKVVEEKKRKGLKIRLKRPASRKH